VKLVSQELPRLCHEFRDAQIIRYYSFLSAEMVLVLGPEAIAELVFTRVDDFAHSANMKLLAEAGLGYAGLMGMRGHEHKVGVY
jgi:hypothetical protein